MFQVSDRVRDSAFMMAWNMCWLNLKRLSFFFIASFSVIGTALNLPKESTLERQTNNVPEPCALLHNFLSAGITTGDLSPANVNGPIPAELAYSCATSASLVKADTLRVLDAVLALLEWHSTLTYLKDPPPGYPFSATDIIGDTQALRGAVENGIIVSEYEFQQNLTKIFASAHDGHLYMNMDVTSVFGFVRSVGDIVSVSLDGKRAPEIYAFHDLRKQRINSSFIPSPITTINGEDVQSWILYQALNTSSQQHDPDAMYNTFTKSPATGGGFSFSGEYQGVHTTIGFKNGTMVGYQNKAILLKNFTGVVDGETFYRHFVEERANKQQQSIKSTIAGLNAVQDAGEIVAAGSVQASYPTPLFYTDDLALSGYFLTDTGFESVAVLTLRSFWPKDIRDFHSNLIGFLQACVASRKQYLILEMQANPGGNIGLGYDVFKQLFPDLSPYAAGNQRSHDQVNILGDFFTELARDVLASTGSIENYTAAGGFSIFDARASINATGAKFETWHEFDGPVLVHGDNFTNVARQDIENTSVEEYLSGFAFSDPPVQPFRSENVIVLADGDCASTCDTFMHLLKWQAKVKTIVGGGRPTKGPMQVVGGVKARHKLSIGYLMYLIGIFRDKAPQTVQEKANATKLKTIFESGEYLARRTNGIFSVNLANAIGKDDKTMTPLQFVYEAADCRVWWRPEHFFNVRTLWTLVAGTAFGLNNTEMWSACVEGSTNHPSSVTGGGNLVFDPNSGIVSDDASTPRSENGTSTSDGSTSAVGKADPAGGSAKNSADNAIVFSTALLLTSVLFGSVVAAI